MKKTFYLQLGENSKIADVIDFPYSDYSPVELETPLPQRILSGAYQLINGELIYRPEWDRDGRIEALEAANADIMLAMAEIYEGGAK